MAITPTTPSSPITPSASSSDVGVGVSVGAAASVQATSSTASASPVRPDPLQTAVQSAVQAAAGAQGGLAGLLSDLSAALANTAGLPPAVQTAANQLLSLQAPLGATLTGDDVRQALAQSGLFLEAQLAAPDAGVVPDLKAALLTLSQALQTWLGAGARAEPATSQPAPPYRGGPLQAQPPVAASLPPDASAELIGRLLLRDTAAALARQVLLQTASLPDAAQRPGQAQTPPLRFEIPFATPQGSAVAPFEIGRDDRGTHAGGTQAPAWSARFSLDLPAMGPVHAQIVLRDAQARVTLWAENSATAARLDAQQEDLAAALRGEDLSPSVSVLAGAPDTPAPSAGRLIDTAL